MSHLITPEPTCCATSPFHSIPLFIPFHICPVTARRITDEEQPSRDERCLYGSRTHLSHPITGHSVMMCHMTIPFHSTFIPFHFHSSIPIPFQLTEQLGQTRCTLRGGQLGRGRRDSRYVAASITLLRRKLTWSASLSTLSKFDLAHTIHKSTYHVM